jgi:hypothetical protein
METTSIVQKKKVGRPLKEGPEKLSSLVMFGLTPTQKQQLRSEYWAETADSGISFSEYVRQRVLGVGVQSPIQLTVEKLNRIQQVLHRIALLMDGSCQPDDCQEKDLLTDQVSVTDESTPALTTQLTGILEQLSHTLHWLPSKIPSYKPVVANLSSTEF